ncbi:meiosis-specific coiled-coil domain-containing protein MEIOC isoform X1 [Lates japonicus]|uniref:Meiosis-specific coiled-coil domain-containing protein MEIOC isoform X1 n=1 Tax=Lates japonicus TaxID=270547 RepID=A0AAD3M8I7_LATJO|nr:meiosis-specific coiled-coil domain-containing protein MEIOC isoform X1 [Lates japonicus]
MAFDGHQSTFANSLFPTYQRQASVNVGGGSNRKATLPFVSVPSVSLQEQDTASYVPWSHNAHDDPCELISCSQSNVKSRKPTDNIDCDGETDLQGLVSNILDEADSQDSYYSEGSLPTCNPVWSPKTLREELLQYFHSEGKMQHNPTFPPNYVSREAFSKAQAQSVDKDVEEIFQQSNGLAINQQWLFNLPNGDRDNYTLRPQKLPPGLPVPNTGNIHLSLMQQSKYDNTSADKDRGNSQPVNNFPDFNDVFRPQSEMNSPCFDPYYEDHHVQSSAKPINTDQYVPQDINQLVSSFQSFMAGEHDSFCCRDFPNMHKQSFGMLHEDSMVEQWKITSPAVSTQSAPAMQTQKQLGGEFGMVQREINGGVRKQIFKHDAFQDLPGFSSQNTEYFQQSEPFTASVNHYQNKMTMHRENFNVNMNQYSKHHIQQGQIQSKIKPHMQKEKKMGHMSGFLGEGFSTRPLTNTHMRAGDKKQVFSQNPYFDFQGGMQSQRFDGENSMVSAGNTQQYMPLMYPVSDLRGHSNFPINSNFSSRPTLPYGSGVPGMDVCDMSASESAAFNSYVSDMMTRRGESSHHGMASAMTASLVMNQGGSVIQLYFYLDECYEQWRCLERERKRTEVILTKTFLGKRTTAVTNTTLPKTPPNPTRVDHLIVKQIREQAKVASLLDRMECLRNVPLHINIHTALNKHHMAICITQARRKEEIANMSKHQRQRAHFTEDRDILLLVIALKDLATTTRKVRTALWCALQVTLPKPVKRQDHCVNKEATGGEGGSSPFEGYTFKL